MPTHPKAAALSMIASMAVIGVIDIYVAVIAETISVWQFLVMRVLIAGPVVALLSVMGFGSLRPKRFKAVALRSTLIATAMFLYFSALAFMPIALALAGLFTSPIFVLLITYFFLKGSIGPWRVIAVLIGFSGCLVVLGPSGSDLGLILLLPVLGGMLYACGVLATRELCEGESTLTLLIGIFIAQGLLGAIVLGAITAIDLPVAAGGAAFLTRGWIWPMQDALPYVLMQAGGSIIGVGLLNRAYQLGSASYVAVFEYSIMIFGPLAAWVLLGQEITIGAVMGICMIAASGTIIGLRSRGETD